ncbi:MAG: PmoA family protein [Planctomycetes bacterium]|nr:PmoA family protein [Planctomycetota bacterium]
MSERGATKWTHESGRSLALEVGGRTLFEHRFDTARCKPHLHPWYTPGGTLLTCLEPWDHVWHRGLWFSWKYLDGVNYWEEREPKTDPEGETVFEGPERLDLSPCRATLSTALSYRDPQGRTVLREERQIVLHAPEEPDALRLDWHMTWTAPKDVKLDRTPPVEPTSWGGYAGLSWRAARSLGKFQALNSESQKDAETHHARARWTALWGLSDGLPLRHAGVAFFDHPHNPRYPTPWYVLLQPGFGYLNPAFLMEAPHTVQAGASFTLRYRVLCFDGPGEYERLEREARLFA